MGKIEIDKTKLYELGDRLEAASRAEKAALRRQYNNAVREMRAAELAAGVPLNQLPDAF